MEIEKEKIILLEDESEYLVLDKISLNGKSYLYICKLNLDNDEDLKFMELIGDRVFTVTDDGIIKELLLIIAKKELKKDQ